MWVKFGCSTPNGIGGAHGDMQKDTYFMHYTKMSDFYNT